MNKLPTPAEAVLYVAADPARSRAFLAAFARGKVSPSYRGLSCQIFQYVESSDLLAICGASNGSQWRANTVRQLQRVGILPSGLLGWVLSFALRWAVERFLEALWSHQEGGHDG